MIAWRYKHRLLRINFFMASQEIHEHPSRHEMIRSITLPNGAQACGVAAVVPLAAYGNLLVDIRLHIWELVRLVGHGANELERLGVLGLEVCGRCSPESAIARGDEGRR